MSGNVKIDLVYGKDVLYLWAYLLYTRAVCCFGRRSERCRMDDDSCKERAEAAFS